MQKPHTANKPKQKLIQRECEFDCRTVCDQEKRVADGKSWANRKSAWKKWIENMRLFNRNKILSEPPKTEIVGNCYIVTQ